MNTLIGIVTLLAAVSLGLVTMRIASVALTLTGLSKDLARFQARSAFTRCGFTTHEAESIVSHPVRRRIVMILMLLGDGIIVMSISSLIPVFVNRDATYGGFLMSLLWLLLGLAILWAIASSTWIDRQMSRVIAWALKRFTRLEVFDYQGLLNLSEGYTVCELAVQPEDWVAGKSLGELRLADEGVVVLGIHREDGRFVGTPTGITYIRAGDRVILYGKMEHLGELDRRRADTAGDIAHQTHVQAHQRVLETQIFRRPRAANADSPPTEP
jgi:K+/H+ antiporter YhaU regulatory subunit KhtT